MKVDNPLKIMAIWVCVSSVVAFLLIIIFAIYTPDSDQKPLAVLPAMVVITAGGLVFIMLVTIPLYWNWTKANWYIYILIISFCIFIFYLKYFKDVKNLYSFSEETIVSNGKSYTKKMEFYDAEEKKIRSISFYLDGKKDSAWTIYSIDGKTLKRLIYRNDSLLRISR